MAAENNETPESPVKLTEQRRINTIWEATQAFIAILVTASTLFAATKLTLNNSGEMAAFLLLSNSFFLVIGFYFGRTNHQRIGGVEDRRP